MHNPAISILVPIYNVEAYLSRCVESVLSQDFTDYELILVDDGSPDHCPQICDEYATRDKRIKVIHKANGGLVSARLAGFQQAKAKYIMFLDSDDWLAEGALTQLLSTAIEGGYDVVKGIHKLYYNEDRIVTDYPRLRNITICDPLQYLESLIRYDIPCFLWAGVYRKDLFSENDFKKIIKISVGEDLLTNMIIWPRVFKYQIIDDVVYYNGVNGTSLMHSLVSSLSYLEYFGALMYQLTVDAGIEIKYLIDRDRCIARIRTFFVPELPWNDKVYSQVRNYLFVNEHLSELRKYIDPKFLKFVRHKPLFFIYSRCYCMLFKILKLKNKTRRILYSPENRK